MTFPGGTERLAGSQSRSSWELLAFRDVDSLQERHSRLGGRGREEHRDHKLLETRVKGIRLILSGRFIQGLEVR